MTATARPPFRAEHIGSLLRPEKLKEAFRKHAAGKLGDEEFAAVQDQAIMDVVKLQEDVGLKVVTDGEFRRPSYWAHFVSKVDGLGIAPALFKFHDAHGHEAEFTTPTVTGRVRRAAGISTDEFDFLKGVTGATPKITMPSAPTMHFWRGKATFAPGTYTDLRAFFADLARVYQEEIEALHQLGCRYVQIDEVPLAALCDPQVRSRVEADGQNVDELISIYIDSLNRCIAGRPAGMRVGLHLCRGNFKGRYLSEGGYISVAERMFGELGVDVFLLEYDTPRAGDFEPLRYVPKDKAVILGLVSSKVPQLEEADALARRIDEAGRFIDRDRLGISPQCGFASTVGGNPVTVKDEIAKLRLVVETAKRVWGSA